MKRVFSLLGLYFTSTFLLAMDCGSLGITITNMSGQDCVLRNKTVLFGSLIDEVPLTIPSGTTSPTFFIQQVKFIGSFLGLDYRCDNNKLVAFSSIQDFCLFSAGDVRGEIYEGNDLIVEYTKTLGNYWAELPGQIKWTIR